MRNCFVIFWGFWGQLAYAHSGAASAPNAIIESYETTRLAVTVYPNDDLAMITEVRTVDVLAGVSEIQFHGVSDMIIAETAILQSFEGLRLEGNFNSDLISKSSLLQKSIGETLTIRRMNSVTGRLEFIDAELVSAAPGEWGVHGAVFKTKDGLEALHCSGLKEAALFSKMPEGLNPIPVLSMTVSSVVAGPKEITLTYLTRGIGWEADYRMDVKEGKPEATLLGWLSLSNNTSKSFEQADLAVVAGALNRAPHTQQPGLRLSATRFYPTCGDNIRRISNDEIMVTGSKYLGRSEYVVVQEASTELTVMADGSVRERSAPLMTKHVSVREATREELGDYKLYRSPQAVTLSPHQTKQIAFLLRSDVEFDRLHKRTIDPKSTLKSLTAPKPTRVEYEIDNDKGGNLAQPLPKGTVRVMSETAGGQTLFIGEDKVDNLAVDLPFDVKIAESFLVTTRFDYETISKADDLYLKASTNVLNATKAPITAEIDFSGLRASHIRRSSVERDLDDVVPTYRFQVAAESEYALTLEIPVIRNVFFVHNRDYKSNKARRNSEGVIKYDKFFKGLRHTLNDGTGDWLLGKLNKTSSSKNMRIGVEQISRTETPANMIEHIETFTFENLTSSTIGVRFEIGRDNDYGPITLMESSIEPNREGTLIWSFMVPGNSKKRLTTTTEVSQ